jgi:glucose/arabinose dehydrogenase
VSERDTGRIKRIAPGGAVSTVGTVPGVDPGGEGGLLGIAVPPDFGRRPYVYAYFTASGDNRIVRMPLQDGRLGRSELILDGIPKGGIHNGGRIVFGPDGLLYAGTGEAGQRNISQDRRSLGGKILRMTPDGKAPADNPFGDSVVFSYGHRNVQGLGFDPDGRLWAAEFGQNTWDELNLIRAGQNYGWPEVEGRGGGDRFVDPLAQWATDEASPSGIAVARGAVWMAGLRGARLWRIPISGSRAGEPRAFLTGDYGRLRTVEPAPDGSLWLVTSNTDGRGNPRRGDDRILRLDLR